MCSCAGLNGRLKRAPGADGITSFHADEVALQPIGMAILGHLCFLHFGSGKRNPTGAAHPLFAPCLAVREQQVYPTFLFRLPSHDPQAMEAWGWVQMRAL